MLEILETGRLPAGIWIPSWEQGLPPLTEAPFPRAYRVAPRSDKKGPEQRTDAMRALGEQAVLLYKLGRKEEALANCEEIARHKGEGPAWRELVAWGLDAKGFLLSELNRKDEALRVCNKIVRRFGRAKKPALRGVVANALHQIEHLLYNLDRTDEVLPVCEQFLRLFGTANEPAAREGMKTTLLCKIDGLWELGRKEEALATCVEFLRLFDTANTRRETIEMVLSAKKTLLRELVLSYNPPDMEQSPDTGDATLKQAQTLLGEAIEKVGVTAAAKMIVEAASPDDRARLIEGMVARGRELTGRDATPVAEPTTQEAKTEAQAFAAALEAMTTQQERHAALAAHYAAGKKNTWIKARGKNPTPEKFLAWLDSRFPDRREIGMVLSDLKYLDEKAAYEKVQNWSGGDSKIPRATIESFGLPSKMTPFDPERDANAPKSLAEVVARAVRGEDTLKNLQRSYARAANHRASLG
jgi:tetratricopeptide (TPR) repeat protein